MGLALDHLAQARGSRSTRGAATEAVWDAHIGEEALLADASCPAMAGEKLRCLLAATQPSGVAALRRREQPQRHLPLRSAIGDVSRLNALLAAAQAEIQRLHKGVRRPLRIPSGVVRLREQLAEFRVELQEAAAERDAALDALIRANKHRTSAALAIASARTALP